MLTPGAVVMLFTILFALSAAALAGIEKLISANGAIRKAITKAEDLTARFALMGAQPYPRVNSQKI